MTDSENRVEIKVEMKLLVVINCDNEKKDFYCICLFVETCLTTTEILIFSTFLTTLNRIAHEKYS